MLELNHSYQIKECSMQKWTHTLSANDIQYSKNNPILDTIFHEKSIFFDIETTGFSPVTTQIYLIGCARRTANTIIIEQFFAENKQDEEAILTAFLKLLENYPTIITFNGIGFDIPYIKAKCDRYKLAEQFSDKEYIDLFKIASRLKFLLNLPNYKQTSIEDFFGIQRKDLFHGGELIQIYQDYIKNPCEQALFFLKQHNYEDVLGMIDLLPIITYQRFIAGNYKLSSIASNLYLDYDGAEQKELIFTLQLDPPLPKRVSCNYEEFYLLINNTEAKLKVRLFEGELKYFFPNYKDYYYLPAEDTAIHKDIAACVDKAHRKKATVSTCYTKKESLFLPQYQLIMEPSFRKQHKDKISYFELSNEFIENEPLMKQYVDHILVLFSTQKNET